MGGGIEIEYLHIEEGRRPMKEGKLVQLVDVFMKLGRKAVIGHRSVSP